MYHYIYTSPYGCTHVFDIHIYICTYSASVASLALLQGGEDSQDPLFL